ncbi:MAG: mevalonate kinase [Chloroflexi bacterium]|nr:mevalonate kinase [Chloroflexota bacterium]
MGSACAKAILFGEHAVVYGEPGIAIPVPQLTVTATFSEQDYMKSFRSLHINSPEVGLDTDIYDLKSTHPIRHLIELLQIELGISELPHKTLTIRSSIPLESGLGSGAATSIAIIRAFSGEYDHPLSVDRVSALAYEIEKIYHGTPSGIDNQVIAHGIPIFFRKGSPVEPLNLTQSLPLIIANSGIKSPTREVVGDIRDHFDQHEQVIHEIGSLSLAARDALLRWDMEQVATLMNENQRLLRLLTASNERLNDLIDIALKAGAPAAKLTGAGRGGNLIALYRNELERMHIQKALSEAGAQVYL